MGSTRRRRRWTPLVVLLALLWAPSTTQAMLTLTLVTTPEFGLFYSGASGRQFVLSQLAAVLCFNDAQRCAGLSQEDGF